MVSVYISDNSKKRIVRLAIESDNIIPAHYFDRTFPGATGLIYKENGSDSFISIPMDERGNFKWQWDSNIVYDLIHADRSRDRSYSSSSNLPRPRSWLTLVRSLLQSTTSTGYEKKTI